MTEAEQGPLGIGGRQFLEVKVGCQPLVDPRIELRFRARSFPDPPSNKGRGAIKSKTRFLGVGQDQEVQHAAPRGEGGCGRSVTTVGLLLDGSRTTGRRMKPTGEQWEPWRGGE